MSENLKASKHKTVTSDKVQVMGYKVGVFPVEQRHIYLEYATGYEDSNGNFIGVKVEKPIIISGEDFDALVGKQPQNGETVYAFTKRELYALIDGRE